MSSQSLKLTARVGVVALLVSCGSEPAFKEVTTIEAGTGNGDARAAKPGQGNELDNNGNAEAEKVQIPDPDVGDAEIPAVAEIPAPIVPIPEGSVDPVVPPLPTPNAVLLQCINDLKGVFGGFALKGGTSAPVKFSEGVSAANYKLMFAAASKVSFAAGRFVAASGVSIPSIETFSAAALANPECKADIPIQLLPDTSFTVGETLQRGVKGNVYQLPVGAQALPDFSQLSPLGSVYMSNFDVPVRRFDTGFPGVRSDLVEWFAIDFRGTIEITTPGSYQFRVRSDDGSKLFIDNKLVVNNDGQHSTQDKSGSITLEKGVFDLKLPYFQGPAYEISLQLFYKGPGVTSWTLVPQSMLKVQK